MNSRLTLLEMLFVEKSDYILVGLTCLETPLIIVVTTWRKYAILLSKANKV